MSRPWRLSRFPRLSRFWRPWLSIAGVPLVLALAGPACTEDVAPAAVDLPTPVGTDAGSDAAGPACPVDPGPIDPTQLIDDFEDGTSVAPMIAGRTGGWYASGDPTTGATLRPYGNAAPDPIPGGRCGSHKALHVSGSGFTVWGAQVILALNYGANDAGLSEELPYDAAARGYQGVTFFARVGDTSVNTVRFAVSDQYSRPEAGLCVPNPGQPNDCYDTFGVSLAQTLSTEWQQFRIPWTGLSQRHFGLQGGQVPDVSKLYDVAFTFPDHTIFDLWVDDISFY